eukprot:2458779-Alexandrium_andersonii.AAC.1
MSASLVGSEMCIRDRSRQGTGTLQALPSRGGTSGGGAMVAAYSSPQGAHPAGPRGDSKNVAAN